MSERGLPPYPLTNDWRAWATQIVEFLIDQARSEEFVAPRVVSLLHQRPPLIYRPLDDGLLMFDPSLGVPVYSKDNEWKQFTAQGDLNYLVTDDAGNGTVVDDINNTDFTGQTGAIGQCAQCPVATNTAFYHKGIQYLYTGPTPASYGAGCADTMQDTYLIPVGAGTFLALTDTPDSYQAQGNRWVRVNASANALVFDDIQEEDIINLNRIRWRGNWVQQTYEKNDMVLADANWLMIANKQTSDVAPPRPVGNPLWDMPDVPAWATSSFNGVVKSGREWEITKPIDARGLAVWIPTVTADTNYVLFAYSYPTGQPDQIKAIQISEPLLVAGQWTVVTLNRQLLTAGTTFGFYIDGLNSGSDTIVSGGWGRSSNTNDGLANPGTGQWNTNNADTRVGLSYTDLDTTDRTSELQGVIAGSTIQVVQTDDASKSVSWTVNADGIDRTTHIDFANVTLADTGPNGQPDVAAVCTVTITVPVPQPTDYVQIVGGNPTHTWGTSRGILELGGVPQSVDANAFGVRILADEYVVSPDWDVASVAGSGGGGGGGGGASTFTQLGDTPTDYAGQAGKVAIVNQGESGLEFEAVQSGATIGDAFPLTPFVGQLHYKTDPEIALYIYYDDGDSLQWVSVTGGGMFELTDAFVSRAGDEMYGPLTINEEATGGDGGSSVLSIGGDVGTTQTAAISFPAEADGTKRWGIQSTWDTDHYSLRIGRSIDGYFNSQWLDGGWTVKDGALSVENSTNHSQLFIGPQDAGDNYTFTSAIAFPSEDNGKGRWALRSVWETSGYHLYLGDGSADRWSKGQNLQGDWFVNGALDVGGVLDMVNGSDIHYKGANRIQLNADNTYLYSTANSNGGLFLRATGTTTNVINIWQKQSNNGARIGLNDNWASGTNWTYSLTYNGSHNFYIHANGTVNHKGLSEISDSKFKRNIVDYDHNGLESINALCLRSYEMQINDTEYKPKHGVVAQELVGKAKRYLVLNPNPDTGEIDLGVDQGQVIWDLVDSVQKLSQMVDDLIARVEELEDKERATASLREEIKRLWAAMPGSHGRGH